MQNLKTAKSLQLLSFDVEMFVSDVGADECLPKPPCSPTDYYQYNSPCDSHNKVALDTCIEFLRLNTIETFSFSTIVSAMSASIYWAGQI